MRYTTIIDITEYPAIWSSASCRTLYLHLVLKSGWHDDDRDMLRASIRQLSSATGLTKSAVEHAIRQLSKAGLLAKKEGAWMVKKWTVVLPPTPRPRKTEVGKDEELSKAMDANERRRTEYQQAVMNALRQVTREELSTWIEELEQGRSLVHYGVKMYANKANIEYLRNYANTH